MSTRKAGHGWRVRGAAFLGVAAFWLLGKTWRMRYVHREALANARERHEPVVFVIWHGQLLLGVWAHRSESVAALISEHGDGEIIARIARALGFRTVRGSSSRGANRALVGLVKELKDGFDVAITPDGPRGPNHAFAAGALLVAQRSGRPILPVGVHVSRAWHMKSWDRFTIPKPFAIVTVAYGELMHAPEGTPTDLSNETTPFQQALDSAVELAERTARKS
ncbi:MAG TPA: lysophospholipid acyltransferase family protein [Gemmatimonadaceae bacterium]